MSPLQKLSWGVIVTAAITTAVWIFGAGAAVFRANTAYGTACEAKTIALDNRAEIKSALTRQEQNHAAVMRELDQIQDKLDK